MIEIDNERALHWLKTGAQPTERAQKLLEISGAWTQFKVATGGIHTVGADAEKAPAKEQPAPEAAVEDAPAEAAADEADEADETTEEEGDA